MFTASSQSKSKEGSIKKTKAQSAIEAAVFDSIQRTLSLLWDRIKDVEFISEREAAEHIQTVCAEVQLFCEQSVLEAKPCLVASLLHRAGVILDKCRSRDIEIGLAATRVSRLLSALNNRWMNVNPQDISSGLYGAGKLAAAGRLKGKFSVQDVDALLRRLSLIKNRSQKNVDSQAIANALYGGGRLAEAGHLSGQISVDNVDALLRLLNSLGRRASSQHISNALWGAGRLAEAVHLRGKFSVQNVDALLERLRSAQRANSQEIANALWGAGRLAEAGHLRGKFSLQNVDALLRLVNRLGRRASPQSIANALWGAGRLAEAGHHTGEISAQNVGDLLVRLSQNDRVKPQEIANALWGAGRLAEAGRLSGNFSLQNVDALLTRLNHDGMRANSQDIANALWGAGRLAKAGRLSGNFSVQNVDALLRLVNRLGRRASPQSIANALWGAGRLAEAGHLRGKFSAQNVDDLLRRLNQVEGESSQYISNALYGAGRLAEAGHYTGEISAQNVGDLLVRLSQNDRVKPQEIANALWGAGRLAEAGHHTGEISAQNVGDLLVRLSQNDRVKPQEIANALYGIAKLMPKQKLSDELMIAMNSSVDTLLSMKDPRRAANVSVCAHVLFKMHGKLSKEVESMLIKDRPRPLPIQENLVKLLAQNFQGSRPEAEKLVGSWFVDVQFTYQGKKYIVEIDGKQHYDEERKLMPKDVARDNALQEMGYYVFRYSNRLSADKIIEQLIAKIKASERLAGQDSDRVTLSPLTAAEQKTMVGENGAVDSCQEGSGLALGPRQPQRKKKKPNPKEERVADFSSPASQSFFQQAYGDSHSTGASASGTAAKLNRGRTG